MRVPVNEPYVNEDDLAAVAECVETGWISSGGKYVDEFEESWARYCGRRHGIVVSNGTAALQLAVACLDLEPGAEIIMPDFTIISCALAAVYADAIPVLVDCDPDTWCMDVTQVEEKITPRTRAIMPVHMYGHPTDMDPVLALARKHGLAVIEDAAEAHGAEYLSTATDAAGSWGRCGSSGTASCFSFYANKIITTGEGGMVLTDDDNLAEKARSKRNLCFRQDRRFLHTELGFNFRMTNIQAALGAVQVKRIEELLERKRRMAQAYTSALSTVEVLQLPTEKEWARSVFWMYSVVIKPDAGLDAAAVTAELKDRGVGTRPFFLGLSQQPVLRDRGLFQGERYPVSDYIGGQGFYLPSGLTITPEQIEYVCAQLTEVLS